VAQHQDLQLLGALPAPEQHHQLEKTAGEDVHQRQDQGRPPEDGDARRYPDGNPARRHPPAAEPRLCTPRVPLKGANSRVAPFADGLRGSADGLVVSLRCVQGVAGRARSESPRLGCQGRRAAGLAPRAGGPAPPGRAPEASRRGSCPARGGGVPPASPLAQRACGDSADAAAVASGARAQAVAATGRPARTPAHDG
jgi:hypothetical protein